MARRYRSGRVPVRDGKPPESTAVPKPLLFGGIAAMAALTFFLWSQMQSRPEPVQAPEREETRVLTPKPAPSREAKPVKAAPVLDLPARDDGERPAFEGE